MGSAPRSAIAGSCGATEEREDRGPGVLSARGTPPALSQRACPQLIRTQTRGGSSQPHFSDEEAEAQ